MSQSAEIILEPVEFFFVWTKKGRVPRFTHQTRESASAEAIRLAEKHPGRKFIVLRAEGKFSLASAAAAEKVAA